MNPSTQKAILVINDKGLEALNTPKPLLTILNKTLLVHQLDQLKEAGVKDFYFIAGKSIDAIKHYLRDNYSFTGGLNFYEQTKENSLALILARIKAKTEEDFIVTRGEMIFEKNPYLYLQKKNNAEILIDKEIEHNKFCGARLKVSRGLIKDTDIGEDLKDYNSFSAGVFWFSAQGLDDLAALADEEDSFEKIIVKYHRKYGFSLSVMPFMNWFNVSTPEMMIRAEMFLRGISVSQRKTEVDVNKLKHVDSPLSFSYSKSNKTKIILKEGVIKEIGKIHLMDPNHTASNHVLITDETVNELYGDIVLEQLKKSGYKVMKLVCPVGEKAKSMEVYNKFAEEIIANGIDEQSIVFALGGGVVANLSGFLAATLYRGIGLIHIPTTFMNMIDVAISLKQGINGQKGKNLVGSYYQPQLVVIDPTISVPDWLVRDGISEAIKHALCQDKEFVEYLTGYQGKLNDIEFRKKVINKTIELKLLLMERDMFENHCAMVLQYGHEIGHAIEFLSHYRLTHGQSIAIGMRATAELSHLMDVTGYETVENHINVVKNFGLPHYIPDYIKKDAILDLLRYNKKTRGNDIRIVLPERIGKVWKIKGEYGIPCPINLIEKAVEKSYTK